jgi:flavorubredoxin
MTVIQEVPPDNRHITKTGERLEESPVSPPQVRIDEVQDGIYRISGFVSDYNITFNQFLVEDEKPTLIHTGPIWMYEEVEKRVKEVIDLNRLHYVVFLHFEADEYGGMQFLESPRAKLVCSRLSSSLNLEGWFNLPKEHIAMWEGETLSIGKKSLRFIMTPHVHHWDSMMVFEETERALFPSDLFLQQGNNTPVTNDEGLASTMIEQYRNVGIFAHEKPVRDILPKLERLNPRMIHTMHGSSLDRSVHAKFFEALRTQDFGYNHLLMFQKVE